MADVTTGQERLDAGELRTRFQWLESFDDDELRKISMCQWSGGKGELFDLCHPENGVIDAADAEAGCCYIARAQLDPELWDKLILLTRH